MDVRYPIGGLFALLGVILGGYGLATAGDLGRHARSEGVNINLWWGLAMLAFGIVMLVLGRRRSRPRPPKATC